MVDSAPPSSKIKNLLTALTREISLRESADFPYTRKFFIGVDGTNAPYGSGCGISWWHSRRTDRALNVVARAICDHLRKFALVDRRAARAAVERALSDNPLNQWVLHCVFSKSVPDRLFHAYSMAGAAAISNVLWNRILSELQATIDDWLFVYPLRLFTAPTIDFPAEGACIVSSSDDEKFERYCADFPGLRTLSLKTGVLGKDIFFSDKLTPSWLFIRCCGVNTVAFAESSRLASTLLGVIVSAERVEHSRNALLTTMASHKEYAAIFSRSSGRDLWRMDYCGPLLHAVHSGYCVSQSAILCAQEWLLKLRIVDVAVRRRAVTAARWVNQGAASRGDTRLLFFFFALDALYGERGNVEERIIEGVTLHMGGVWAKKCRWLYRLRSELVHGGAAATEDWAEIERYRDHFESEPYDDIEELAAMCLIDYLRRRKS